MGQDFGPLLRIWASSWCSRSKEYRTSRDGLKVTLEGETEKGLRLTPRSYLKLGDRKKGGSNEKGGASIEEVGEEEGGSEEGGIGRGGGILGQKGQNGV